MRAILVLLLAFIPPLLANGQDVIVSDAAGWKPMPAAQVEMIRKQAAQQGGYVMDASLCDTGGATLLALPRQGVFSALENEAYVTGFIHGVEGTGPRAINQVPVVVQALKGKAITFQGRGANGQDLTLLSYVLFGARETYTLSLYGRNLTQTDPVVLAYLARLKVSPAAIPTGASTTSAFELGELIGRFIVWIVVATFGVWVFLRIVGRFRKRRADLRPPPLSPYL